MRCTIVLLCLTASCGDNSVDPAPFSKACTVDTDCTLLPFDNVCGGCGTDAVSASDQSARDAIEAAQGSCWSIDDCLQVEKAVCIDETCSVAPR